ncbi:hypothetical protein J1605_017825 [Eschrichtius robustus]|uniref:Uncharacterized protein n=1 Tax=Eschrichtius robustus TaxID=9764 RepID=A0AB34HXK5_ESCRO|nr:hypothetical protein J1605_017825 [Eschrichtius robustus]
MIFALQQAVGRLKVSIRTLAEGSLFTNALSPSASLNCHLIPDTDVVSFPIPSLENQLKTEGGFLSLL